MTERASLLALLLLLAACAEGPPETIAVDPEEHARRVKAFSAARDAELAAPDSWLSLIGLHWLEQGETTVGSDPENRIVLPEPSAPRVGTLLVEGSGVRWRTEPGVVVTQGVDSTLALQAGSGAIPPDVSEDPPVDEADLTADLGSGSPWSCAMAISTGSPSAAVTGSRSVPGTTGARPIRRSTASGATPPPWNGGPRPGGSRTRRR